MAWAIQRLSNGLLVECFVNISEIPDLTSILFTCKFWAGLLYQVCVTFCSMHFSHVPGECLGTIYRCSPWLCSSSRTGQLQDLARPLHSPDQVRYGLLRRILHHYSSACSFAGYYHLPKLFQTIHFKSKLSQASMTAQSSSVTVCFADGGIAQFPVIENQKSGDIIESIVYAIGLTGHADYCFQLVEGDFKKPRWLSKSTSLGMRLIDYLGERNA